MTHHFIVQWAAYLAGREHNKSDSRKLLFYDYAILGDDVVIRDEMVAFGYMKIMGGLDVSISLPKSHISKNVAEFAKSLYVEGTDLTPLPVAIIEDRPDYYFEDRVILLDWLNKRNLAPDFKTFIEGVGNNKDNNDLLIFILSCPRNASYYPFPEFGGNGDFIGHYVDLLSKSGRLKQHVSVAQTLKNVDRLRREDPYPGMTLHSPWGILSSLYAKSLPIKVSGTDKASDIRRKTNVVLGSSFVMLDPDLYISGFPLVSLSPMSVEDSLVYVRDQVKARVTMKDLRKKIKSKTIVRLLKLMLYWKGDLSPWWYCYLGSRIPVHNAL